MKQPDFYQKPGSNKSYILAGISVRQVEKLAQDINEGFQSPSVFS